MGRRAIVKVDIFGKERKLKFGLWTESDPPIDCLSELEKNVRSNSGANILKGDYDIGIYPGDKVIDETGVYEDQIFTVTKVDAARREIFTTIEMFGTMVKLQFSVDEVRKVKNSLQALE